MHLRHVRPSDAAELARGFERLSPSSRYRRFLTGGTALSSELLRYLTCVDGHDHVAIVAATNTADGHETGIGIARFIRAKDDPDVAEAAVTVVDEMQHKGVGRRLALTLARAALERGVLRFRGELLAENDPMRRLLADAGATVRPSEDRSLVFEVQLGSHDPQQLESIVRRLLRAVSRSA